jgi:hypothetical protein
MQFAEADEVHSTLSSEDAERIQPPRKALLKILDQPHIIAGRRPELLHDFYRAIVERSGTEPPAVEQEFRRVLSAIASYEHWAREEFHGAHDHFRLLGEDNFRRYLPVEPLRIRVHHNDSLPEVFCRAAAVFWELSYCALIWPALTRPWMLLMAVIVHLGIIIALGMPTFGLAMLIGNLAFVSPKMVRKVFDPFARRVSLAVVGKAIKAGASE